MLRRALVVAAFASSFAWFGLACKKADSKEVGASTAADSRVATQEPAPKDSAAPVTPDDAVVEGSAAPNTPPDAVGSAKGTSVTTRGTAEGADPKTGGDTTNGDDSYSLTISAPAPVAAGASATAKLTVKPGKGYKMNKDFPTKLTIEAPAGVTLAKTTFEAEDAIEFDDKQLVFAVDCTPGSTGTYTVSGKLKFAVCTDATCDPKRQAISFAVAAK